MSVLSEELTELNKIKLHKAKLITNEHAFIYDQLVLNSIGVNSIVRISYELIYKSESWRHDSPFVKIKVFNEDEMLGEVQNINRISDNKYALNIGENIWFKKENIIEIKTNVLDVSEFLTNDKVMITGPLYTIESESDNDSRSESESEKSADSEESSASESD